MLRDRMIYMPPAIMNEAVNTINAPITGCGMINNRAAYFGMKATMTRIAAQENPM